MDLNQKVNQSVKLLKTVAKTTDEPMELSYSGGKDSDVILRLAQMAGINFRAIYKNTTIDPPGTIKHCRENGVEIIQPKKTFFQIIQENGLPTRWARFCCAYLKEYVILNKNIMGIRRSESIKRTKRYKEPEVCRNLNGKHQISYLPILEWNNEDVRQFIEMNNIKCHPLYYDKHGRFNVEMRLGCIGCVLASQKKRREQFIKYPKMLKHWIFNFQIYLDSHKDTKQYVYSHGSAYNYMFRDLFCDSLAQCDDLLTGCLFPETKIDSKSFLENYFKIDL